jgi:hypothetical protein
MPHVSDFLCGGGGGGGGGGAAENIKAIDFMFADFAEVAHQNAQDALNGGAPSEDEEEDAVQHREHHVAHHNFGCTVRHYNLCARTHACGVLVHTCMLACVL